MKRGILKIGFSTLLLFSCFFVANAMALDNKADEDAVVTLTDAAADGVDLAGLVDKLVTCENPRPEICYETYKPVCAVRQTERRCLTTPCPQTEQVVYANDCKACADRSVIGFKDFSTCPVW